MGHEVKWVGYLGCLTWRVIHFEMGSCFGWRVAERRWAVCCEDEAKPWVWKAI